MFRQRKFIQFMLRAFLLGGASTLSAPAQSWDVGERLSGYVSRESDGKFKLGFENTIRYESRTAVAFGASPDLFTGLERVRVSLSYFPRKWLKISGMVQDARSPWYGKGATGSVRDEVDLQEGYLALFPDKKTGPGLTVGRIMVNYGEGRLLASPQWGNPARTYDHVRAWYGTKRAHFEFLLLSPIKVRPNDFNYPVLGDRVWGMYHTFPDFWKKSLAEVYLLRHDQNHPGGFTGGSREAGTDRLRVNLLGFRLAGPIGKNYKYSVEMVGENGTVGAGKHRAAAGYWALSRQWTLAGRKVDLIGEYKYASGNKNPSDARYSRTFDQLYPANHDKFGHIDLFGWRNIRNVQSVGSMEVAKGLAVHLMYNNSWLTSAKDALYNLGGNAIARVPSGTAGRHVGQGADIFGTYRYHHFLFGAGYGYLWAGRYLQVATPGVSPSLFYIFHSYRL